MMSPHVILRVVSKVLIPDAGQITRSARVIRLVSKIEEKRSSSSLKVGRNAKR